MDAVELMTTGGYSIVCTGGNCRAWEKDNLPHGRFAWITDLDNDLPRTTSEPCLVGLYNRDGDYIVCAEADDLNAALIWVMSAAIDPLAKLSEELKQWCAEQTLPYVSADELILADPVDAGQRQWLTDFIERWDAVDRQ